MNVFSVHSIGWVATRDLFGDVFRKRLGLAPRFDNAALGRVAGCWEALSAAVSDDRRTAGLVLRLAYPRRVPLSATSEAAFRAFLEELVAAAPALYSREALRERCLSRCANFLGSSLVCLMIGHSAPPGSHAAGAAIASFFVVACWSLATAAQLFNAFRVLESLGRG